MKNQRLGFLLLIVLMIACTSAANKATVNGDGVNGVFSISADTFHIEIKGNMTHALKYRNKYYVLFEGISGGNYGGTNKRWLTIFSDGKIEKEVDLPHELEVSYLDFYVYHDSVILKPYMDERIYCFDSQAYTWNKIDRADDVLFEDESYSVYSLDFGEWGAKTWFKDKKTGLEYELEANSPLINKIDSSYYLSSGLKVLKIDNPLLLNPCSDDLTYEKIESSKRGTSWYGKPIGFQTIYEDSTYNQFDFAYHPRIVSSFVWKKRFLHVYETNTTTYLAKIENNKLQIIQKIADHLRFFEWAHSYRCKNCNGNNELLKFTTKDEQLSGLLDIVDNTIHIHFLKNKAELSPKSLGKTKANELFEQRFNLALSGLPNLPLSKTEQAEKSWKSFENTPNHEVGIGDCWNPKKYTINHFQSFVTKEDSIISYTTEYYATKENNLVRIVFFEWNDAEDWKRKIEERTRILFKEKLLFLENYITQKVGNPVKRKKDESSTEETWKTPNGLTIELENMKDYNRIRLILYQR